MIRTTDVKTAVSVTLALLITGLVLAACANSATRVGDIPNQTVQSQQGRSNPYSYRLLVADSGNVSVPAAVLAFGIPTAGGNIAPIQDITGKATGLTFPYAITAGPSGAIFVDDQNNQQVFKFSKDATGNSAPLLTLNVSGRVLGLAVDASGHPWVGINTVYGYGAIYEYAVGASGNAKPINTISGSNANLYFPSGLSFDSSGNLYVSDGGTETISEFAANASGNASPINTISGSHTKIFEPGQITIDGSTYGNGRIVVANGTDVLVFGPKASGDSAPIADISTISSPGGVATDTSGNIYASKTATGAILEFAPGANGNADPIRKIVGSNTKLSSPGNLFIAPN